MSTHNIGFNKEISIIIPYHQIPTLSLLLCIIGQGTVGVEIFTFIEFSEIFCIKWFLKKGLSLSRVRLFKINDDFGYRFANI